jgi:hypothetical protein
VKIPDSIRNQVGKEQIIFVATSDKKGTPHLAAARGLIVVGESKVAFKNWFCLQTLRNVDENPKIALSFFGPDGDHGFQLVGTVEKFDATEVMDGYVPGEEKAGGMLPQARYQLLVRVDKCLRFSTGVHSDDSKEFM